MNRTYDPILEIIETRRVPRTLRAPELGVALVFDRVAGPPLVHWPGQGPMDERIGKVRRIFRVDIANRALSFSDRSSSNDQAFPFAVTVEFVCQVRDPLAIVTDRVRDMTAALRPSLMAAIRQITPNYDAMDAARTENAIATRLLNETPSHTVALSGFAVTVQLVDAAHIVSVHRENRVQKMRYDAMRPIVDGGREALLANDMALNGGDSSDFLAREQAGMLNALRLLKGDNNLEDINATTLTEHAMDAFFGHKPKELKSEGMRERIARKHRSYDDGDVIDEPPSSSASDPSGNDADAGVESPSESRRPSRIRGTANGGRRRDES